jgi:RNA polymerase sigma-70 factor (ECF subfamily)
MRMQDATTWRSSPTDAETAPDEPLVRAAQLDPDAFWLLYERHRPAVYRYLRARTTQDEDAADLTATTFERAFAGIGRYQPHEAVRFRAWLFRIARNAAVDAARRRKPAMTLDAIAELPAGAAASADPERAVLDVERIREVRRLVASLPEPQREAIALRYAGDLTAREIGDVIGKSEAATQKILTRALARLKEAYGDRD